MKKELSLELQVKNLQVSISIYKKEIKEILQSLPALSTQQKQIKLQRLTVCDKAITTKEQQLIPLKEQLALTKPPRTSKIQVSESEIQQAMNKYNIK